MRVEVRYFSKKGGTKRLAEQGRIIVVEGCLLQFEFLYREIAFHVFDVVDAASACFIY